MKRSLLPLAALVAAVAGGLVAASLTVAADAATVNGTAITRSSLDGDLSAIAASPSYQCYLDAQVVLQSQGTSHLPPVDGAGASSPGGTAGTFNSTFVQYWLSRLVDEAVVAQLDTSRHVGVTAADLATARQEYAAIIDGTFATLSQAGVQPSCGVPPSGSQTMATLPASFVDEQVRAVAQGDALSASAAGYALTASGLQAFFDAYPSKFETICVNGLTVATQASAQQLRSRIEAGLPFAQAAPAGTLQSACLTPSDGSYAAIAGLVNGLAPGQVSQPAGSSTGTYYLFQLTGRQPATLSAVQPVLRQMVVSAGAGPAQRLVAAATKRAAVSVDPRYGRWTSSSASRGLLPALSPPAPSLLSPAADFPATGAGTPTASAGTGGATSSGSAG